MRGAAARMLRRVADRLDPHADRRTVHANFDVVAGVPISYPLDDRSLQRIAAHYTERQRQAMSFAGR